MARTRAAAYAVGVAVAVFAYLALPLLRELYGPVVNLPVYAAVALTAGICTYSLVRTIQGIARDDAGDPAVPGDVGGESAGDDAAADHEGEGTDRPAPDVDRELEQIKEEGQSGG